MRVDSNHCLERIKDGYWFSVQIKPVGNICNLDCKYCYAKPFSRPNQIMSEEIFERTVRQCLQNSSYPTFSWHGGEPTLAGYDFFQRAMNLMERYRQSGQKIRNLIQTNATKITPKLAKLFKKYNFGISVSLDGPEHVHGINRILMNGDNSFPDVMRGIKVIRESGLDPSVICTVSKETLPFATETFNFLVAQGFKRIKYSPVFDSLEDKFSITSSDWFEYLKAVFCQWFNIGDPTIQVRDLDEVIIWLSRKSMSLCSVDRTCLHWVSINPAGEIYPCEYLRDGYHYSNITQMELSDVFYSHGFQEFKKAYETIPIKCQQCEFFKLCGNGCPATRVKNGKISSDGVYAFCEERQALFHEIKKAFDATLKGGD
jgi:uncharacterized protein